MNANDFTEESLPPIPLATLPILERANATGISPASDFAARHRSELADLVRAGLLQLGGEPEARAYHPTPEGCAWLTSLDRWLAGAAQ